MGEILDIAEALWKGEKDTTSYHPFGPPTGIEKIAHETWFYKGFSNTVIRKTDDGLFIVDPSGFMDAQAKFDAVKSVVEPRLNTAIFTHGHVDHVFGVSNYIEFAQSKGWPRPKVIAHQFMLNRFQRYRETSTWNGIINGRQFLGKSEDIGWPVEYHTPDILYSDRLSINVGGVNALLRHTRGETDDHTWVFFTDTGVLCTGDLFIYAIPNAGNPQKVQRYAHEWSVALREMVALNPEVLAPGHGFPILGADHVKQALEDTASFLESIQEQTLAHMNRGASLDTVIHAVKAPDDLVKRPYLKPVYDETEFIVRNIWRLYGGWYDGIPSHLKPAPEKDQAQEIVGLAGGVEKLVKRADELLETGEMRMACHMADWAYGAEPDNPDVREIVRRVYTTRAEAESSTMAIGIYRSRAGEMEDDL